MSIFKAVLGTVVVAGAIAAGIWWWNNRDPADGGDDSDLFPLDQMEQEGEGLVASASQVTGATAVRDTLWIEVESSGRAEAFRRVTLRAQADGIAMAVNLRENRFVRGGDLLLAIDTTEYAMEVAQAESDLQRAYADYREMTLFDDRTEDPELREERERNALARSGLEQARVSLDQAKMRLGRTRLAAPFSGLLADVKVVEDQWVSSGSDVVTIIEPHPVKMEAQVVEGDLGRVREGRAATMTFAAFPEEVFTGTVATINPLVDPELRTGKVTIVVANPDLRIKPGMYAEVSIAAEALPDRIIIPKAALLERGEGMRRFLVLVYETDENGEGVGRYRYVNPGRENATHVEILAEGPETGMIEPGEIVLVDGHHFLGDGVPVTLVEDDGNGGEE